MQRNGFTLIELLVVIAVVAVLAGLLFPAIQSVRESANGVRCQANQRQVASAMIGYASDWDDVLPPLAIDGQSFFGSTSLWYTNLLHNTGYMPVTKWQAQTWGNVRTGVYRCPSWPTARMQNCGGFGLIEAFTPAHRTKSTNGDAITPGISLRASGNSMQILLADNEYGPLSVIAGKSEIGIRCPQCALWSTTNVGASGRHRGKANLVHLDTHTASRTPADLLTDTIIWGH